MANLSISRRGAQHIFGGAALFGLGVGRAAASSRPIRPISVTVDSIRAHFAAALNRDAAVGTIPSIQILVSGISGDAFESAAVTITVDPTRKLRTVRTYQDGDDIYLRKRPGRVRKPYLGWLRDSGLRHQVVLAPHSFVPYPRTN